MRFLSLSFLQDLTRVSQRLAKQGCGLGELRCKFHTYEQHREMFAYSSVLPSVKRSVEHARFPSIEEKNAPSKTAARMPVCRSTAYPATAWGSFLIRSGVHTDYVWAKAIL